MYTILVAKVYIFHSFAFIFHLLLVVNSYLLPISSHISFLLVVFLVFLYFSINCISMRYCYCYYSFTKKKNKKLLMTEVEKARTILNKNTIFISIFLQNKTIQKGCTVLFTVLFFTLNWIDHYLLGLGFGKREKKNDLL